jgi:hypothetical protein
VSFTDCVTQLKNLPDSFQNVAIRIQVKFKMNQTANEIQSRMYHPLITSVNRKEEIPAHATKALLDLLL